MVNDLSYSKQQGAESHFVLEAESILFLWIPASAGMATNVPSHEMNPGRSMSRNPNSSLREEFRFPFLRGP
jgi:hypothetical protein